MSVPTITSSSSTTASRVEMAGGSIDIDHSASSTTFSVTGSVDLANSATFGEVVGGDHRKVGRVVLDLTNVDFFGTAALSVLAGLDDDCSRDSVELVLVTSDAVTRVMKAARWAPSAPSAETVTR